MHIVHIRPVGNCAKHATWAGAHWGFLTESAYSARPQNFEISGDRTRNDNEFVCRRGSLLTRRGDVMTPSNRRSGHPPICADSSRLPTQSAVIIRAVRCWRTRGIHRLGWPKC
jgi:hypothetical protein